MREQDEQRDLTNVGAFAGHVWPGDESDLHLPIQVCVVRYKTLLAQVLLQNRVTPLADQQYAPITYLRAAVVMEPGRSCERSQDVQLRQGCGRALNALQLSEHLFAHLLKKLKLELKAPFFSSQNLSFHLLQLGRDETLAICDCLLTNIMRRHLVQVCLSYFDVVAKDGVEADL